MKANNQDLWLYLFLSKFSRPQSYKGKIMTIAFVGTHVPLLALLFYFLFINSYSLEMTIRVLAIALIATLTGTFLTLYALNQLLAPIILTYLAQREYIAQKTIPNLPTKYKDEAGMLMSNTVQTLKKLDEVIEHLTNYDAMTGLPNQTLFAARLQQDILRMQERNRLLGVIVLKLNNLREINNALGITSGDRLLRIVAQKLSAALPTLGFICRISTDEFTFVLSDLNESQDVMEFCQLVLDRMALPISLHGKQVNIFMSLGVAIYPFDGEGVEQLLQNGRLAVDEAQRNPVNSYQFYAEDMNAQLQERFTLESQLRYALERKELLLYYQPRMDINGEKIVSVEALLRWRHHELGLVSPVKFIPIAEANGLIIPIGEWVLRTACTQNRLWQEAGFKPLCMAVNLSARQLAQPNLIERIALILEETQLDSAYLELEVTESVMIENIDQSINILRQLQELGIKVALDDFGTGYSSLNYLRRFPINTLKIDRSFVREVVENSHDAAVINAIISLGKTLGLNITAEGVETQEQYEYIKAQGCHEIQGFYFSPPIPGANMTQLLQQFSNE